MNDDEIKARIARLHHVRLDLIPEIKAIDVGNNPIRTKKLLQLTKSCIEEEEHLKSLLSYREDDDA